MYDDLESAILCERQGRPKQEFTIGARIKSKIWLPFSVVVRDAGTIIGANVRKDYLGKHCWCYTVKLDHYTYGERQLWEYELSLIKKAN